LTRSSRLPELTTPGFGSSPTCCSFFFVTAYPHSPPTYQNVNQVYKAPLSMPKPPVVKPKRRRRSPCVSKNLCSDSRRNRNESFVARIEQNEQAAQPKTPELRLDQPISITLPMASPTSTSLSLSVVRVRSSKCMRLPLLTPTFHNANADRASPIAPSRSRRFCPDSYDQDTPDQYRRSATDSVEETSTDDKGDPSTSRTDITATHQGE
jgi:hypothetical protein